VPQIVSHLRQTMTKFKRDSFVKRYFYLSAPVHTFVSQGYPIARQSKCTISYPITIIIHTTIEFDLDRSYLIFVKIKYQIFESLFSHLIARTIFWSIKTYRDRIYSRTNLISKA